MVSVDEGDSCIVKSKTLAVSLGIILITLICTMDGLDAPEYVRCNEIGVCEFLEVSGDLTESHRFKTSMLMPVTQTLKGLIRVGVHGRLSICSLPWPASKRDISFIMSRCLHSFQDIVFSLPRTDDTVSINTGPKSPPKGNSLPSEGLKFITTSIIRS